MTQESRHDAYDPAHDRLRSLVRILNGLAARSDSMCLKAGVLLGDAVSRLNNLSGQFASLSTMLLEDGDMKPARVLETVASDILTIGLALKTETDAVQALIALNDFLARHIAELADEVRFLLPMVSNVQIEIAAIADNDHRLDGFADSLKQLAGKSEKTVKGFQSNHKTLLRQLHRTASAQSAFMLSHGRTFQSVAGEIGSSLEAVSDRRKSVAEVAEQIGTITQKIGGQIAQCVIALQIGDSTRQRLEHARDGVTMAADVAAGSDPSLLGGDADPQARERVAGKICQLQSIQTSDAAAEFSTDIAAIGSLIERIEQAGTDLSETATALVCASPREVERSFLVQLEEKLAVAMNLLDECVESRKFVDDMAEQVVTAILELKELAKSVASMAIDMTIIGTNAVVTSYRLGSLGLPLSVIAQHIRNHAVNVAETVTRVRPALDSVLEGAEQFIVTRKGKDAGSMVRLGASIRTALGAFRDDDATVAQVVDRLAHERDGVATVLRETREALSDAVDLDEESRQVVTELEDIAAEDDEGAAELPEDLARTLRSRYTMKSERDIHDIFLGTLSPPPAVGRDADAGLWL